MVILPSSDRVVKPRTVVGDECVEVEGEVDVTLVEVVVDVGFAGYETVVVRIRVFVGVKINRHFGIYNCWKYFWIKF